MIPDLRQFLILCLRGRRDGAAAQEASRLIREQRLDWEAVLRLAEAESVGPLLYSSLGGKDLLPPVVEGTLRAAYLHTARRNMLLFHELGKVLECLRAHEISVIVLKGAALAETVYQNIAVRPMVDLDVLVQREAAPTVLRLLADLNYQPDKTEPHGGDALAYESELMLRKPGQVECWIEVHWNLVDSPYYQHRLPLDWFWQTAASAKLDTLPIRVLSGEAQVLYLCAHLLLHHRGQGLLWLHDVAEILAFYQHELNWQHIIARAQAFEWVLPMQHVLPAVVRDWQAPVPPEALAELSQLRPSASEARVFNWLTVQDRPVAQRFWADVRSLPTWRSRARYALRNLFPSRAYMQRRYRVSHMALLPFYYVYRWVIGLRSLLALWSKGTLHKS